jgi:hypothetical protein
MFVFISFKQLNIFRVTEFISVEDECVKTEIIMYTYVLMHTF